MCLDTIMDVDILKAAIFFKQIFYDLNKVWLGENTWDTYGF